MKILNEKKNFNYKDFKQKYSEFPFKKAEVHISYRDNKTKTEFFCSVKTNIRYSKEDNAIYIDNAKIELTNNTIIKFSGNDTLDSFESIDLCVDDINTFRFSIFKI